MKRAKTSEKQAGCFINFGCQGPVGKGLGLDLENLEGLHVAFTAGTGSLVFIDLVARIFLQNYSKLLARHQMSEKGKLLDELQEHIVDSMHIHSPEKFGEAHKKLSSHDLRTHLSASKSGIEHHGAEGLEPELTRE